MEQTKEIMQLRRDVNRLQEIVEGMATILNKKLVEELYDEADNIENGEYYAEEEFVKRHKLKTH